VHSDGRRDLHSRHGRAGEDRELAEDMIRLSGLTPYEDVDIVFTGVRKGEKLFEELEITGENLDKTNHPKIFIGKIAEYSNDEVERIVSSFQQRLSKIR
jgi:FlaA1/EpsC-like NDP-sugar epimerase